MTNECGSCQCPFCSPGKIRLSSWTGDFSKTWRAWIIGLLLLLSRGVAAFGAESGLSRASGIAADASTAAQKIYITSSDNTECSSGNCDCRSIGKCKPCSRFELARQAAECLRTGYKKLAYCPSLKKEKYISCHYDPNPRESQKFWLFQGVAVLVGALSYGVVYLRQKRIERMVANRIQQQINA